MAKSLLSEAVAGQRGGDAAPAVLTFRTWGIDLHKARYGMPPRRHTLTKRVLHRLTPVQIFNAHKGMGFAAMQERLPMEELRLMLVKQERLVLELVERLMRQAGVPYVVALDQEPMEAWQTGEEKGE